MIKIGVIICDRYRDCAGGKCFRALREREGAFSIYKGEEVEIAAYANCGGCPGGNVEYAPEEMKKNGISKIHFATGCLVGYPPCPRLDYFERYIREKFGLEVIFGTHPIPQKYHLTHAALGTWKTRHWQGLIAPALADEETRLKYD